MIYFIQQGESGPIKIGFTTIDVRFRLSQLQTGSPKPLHIIGTMDGDKSNEIEIHTRFANLNYRAEWFHPGPDLINFIQQNTVPLTYRRNGNPVKTAISPEYFNHLDAYNAVINNGMQFASFKDFLVYYQHNNGPVTHFPGFRIGIKIESFKEWLKAQPVKAKHI